MMVRRRALELLSRGRDGVERVPDGISARNRDDHGLDLGGGACLSGQGMLREHWRSEALPAFF
jgi:hypothetical protein